MDLITEGMFSLSILFYITTSLMDISDSILNTTLSSVVAPVLVHSLNEGFSTLSETDKRKVAFYIFCILVAGLAALAFTSYYKTKRHYDSLAAERETRIKIAEIESRKHLDRTTQATT